MSKILLSEFSRNELKEGSSPQALEELLIPVQERLPGASSYSLSP